MKIISLIQANDVLQQFGNVKLSPRLAYKIMKFCKDSSSEYEFYDARRMQIINMYANKNENNEVIINNKGMVSIPHDKIDLANNELQSLNEVEVEAPNVKFKLSELDELKLSVADMYALDAFIEE